MGRLLSWVGFALSIGLGIVLGVWGARQHLLPWSVAFVCSPAAFCWAWWGRSCSMSSEGWLDQHGRDLGAAEIFAAPQSGATRAETVHAVPAAVRVHRPYRS